jgi:nucleotide-binding universal stress UspA family protein
LKVKTEPVEKLINTKKLTQDFLNKIKFHLGNNTIQILINESSSETTILETLKELNADVIVMGSQGRNWSNDRLIGSTTQQISLHTAIPVLIIPIKERYS